MDTKLICIIFLILIIINICISIQKDYTFEFFGGFGCKKPIYDENLWNNNKIIKYNNCYSYAFNEPDPTKESKLDIGRLSNNRMKKDNFTCNHLNNLLLKDRPNITKVSGVDSCGCNEYGVAMVLDDNETPYIDDHDDFHFYRKDYNSEYWSHKPGSTPVSRLDANGDMILNPELADRKYKNWDYNQFCGYYCVPHDDSQYNYVKQML